MIRSEYNNLSISELKLLMEKAIEIINLAAPYDDIVQLTQQVSESVSGESDLANLQSQLFKILKIIVYWDGHQDNHGFFRKVEKNILKDKLNDLISIEPPHRPILNGK